MRTAQKTTTYRQGDVLLQRVDSLPKTGLTEVPRVDGKLVVALGTSNGNAHYLDDKGSKLFKNADGDQMLKLAGQRIAGTFLIQQSNRLHLLVDLPKLGLVAFAKDDVTPVNGSARIKGSFALLKHAEHYAQAIPAGSFNHVAQRGFNRGEILRVQD